MAAGGKSTTVKLAISAWEKKKGQIASEAEVVKLFMQIPPITAMDGLASLHSVKYLSLATNNIERMSLPSLQNLTTLSLSRNAIKKLEGLESVAGTLENLWVSYNQIERLQPITVCHNLKQFFLRHNRVKAWSEFEYMVELPKLEDVEFIGNPLEVKIGAPYREQALQRLSKLKRLDGLAIVREDSDDEGKSKPAAAAAEPEAPPIDQSLGVSGARSRRGSVMPEGGRGGRRESRSPAPRGR